VNDEIREILRLHGNLPADPRSLAADADLYAVGLSSHASVGVMLALEERFDVEFPDEMLTPDVFRSIDAIRNAVTELAGGS
jgi:acyl carrier protein